MSAWTDVNIGNMAFANSYLKYQELIIWPSDQSANRAAIEANINEFYNIYTP